MAGFVDQFLDEYDERKAQFDPYLYWEPWDCGIPSKTVVENAQEDGVDLHSDPSIKLAGEYPRTFQTGAALSTKKMVVTQAGSQVGKSITTGVVIAAMISHLPPHALRFPKGEDIQPFLIGLPER